MDDRHFPSRLQFGGARPVPTDPGVLEHVAQVNGGRVMAPHRLPPRQQPGGIGTAKKIRRGDRVADEHHMHRFGGSDVGRVPPRSVRSRNVNQGLTGCLPLSDNGIGTSQEWHQNGLVLTENSDNMPHYVYGVRPVEGMTGQKSYTDAPDVEVLPHAPVQDVQVNVTSSHAMQARSEQREEPDAYVQETPTSVPQANSQAFTNPEIVEPLGGLHIKGNESEEDSYVPGSMFRARSESVDNYSTRFISPRTARHDAGARRSASVTHSGLLGDDTLEAKPRNVDGRFFSPLPQSSREDSVSIPNPPHPSSVEPTNSLGSSVVQEMDFSSATLSSRSLLPSSNPHGHQMKRSTNNQAGSIKSAFNSGNALTTASVFSTHAISTFMAQHSSPAESRRPHSDAVCATNQTQHTTRSENSISTAHASWGINRLSEGMMQQPPPPPPLLVGDASSQQFSMLEESEHTGLFTISSFLFSHDDGPTHTNHQGEEKAKAALHSTDHVPALSSKDDSENLQDRPGRVGTTTISNAAAPAVLPGAGSNKNDGKEGKGFEAADNVVEGDYCADDLQDIVDNCFSDNVAGDSFDVSPQRWHDFEYGDRADLDKNDRNPTMVDGEVLQLNHVGNTYASPREAEGGHSGQKKETSVPSPLDDAMDDYSRGPSYSGDLFAQLNDAERNRLAGDDLFDSMSNPNSNPLAFLGGDAMIAGTTPTTGLFDNIYLFPDRFSSDGSTATREKRRVQSDFPESPQENTSRVSFRSVTRSHTPSLLFGNGEEGLPSASHATMARQQSTIPRLRPLSPGFDDVFLSWNTTSPCASPPGPGRSDTNRNEDDVRDSNQAIVVVCDGDDVLSPPPMRGEIPPYALSTGLEVSDEQKTLLGMGYIGVQEDAEFRVRSAVRRGAEELHVDLNAGLPSPRSTALSQHAKRLCDGFNAITFFCESDVRCRDYSLRVARGMLESVFDTLHSKWTMPSKKHDGVKVGGSIHPVSHSAEPCFSLRLSAVSVKYDVWKAITPGADTHFYDEIILAESPLVGSCINDVPTAEVRDATEISRLLAGIGERAGTPDDQQNGVLLITVVLKQGRMKTSTGTSESNGNKMHDVIVSSLVFVMSRAFTFHQLLDAAYPDTSQLLHSLLRLPVMCSTVLLLHPRADPTSVSDTFKVHQRMSTVPITAAVHNGSVRRLIAFLTQEISRLRAGGAWASDPSNGESASQRGGMLIRDQKDEAGSSLSLLQVVAADAEAMLYEPISTQVKAYKTQRGDTEVDMSRVLRWGSVGALMTFSNNQRWGARIPLRLEMRVPNGLRDCRRRVYRRQQVRGILLLQRSAKQSADADSRSPSFEIDGNTVTAFYGFRRSGEQRGHCTLPITVDELQIRESGHSSSRYGCVSAAGSTTTSFRKRRGSSVSSGHGHDRSGSDSGTPRVLSSALRSGGDVRERSDSSTTHSHKKADPSPIPAIAESMCQAFARGSNVVFITLTANEVSAGELAWKERSNNSSSQRIAGLLTSPCLGVLRRAVQVCLSSSATLPPTPRLPGLPSSKPTGALYLSAVEVIAPKFVKDLLYVANAGETQRQQSDRCGEYGEQLYSELITFEPAWLPCGPVMRGSQYVRVSSAEQFESLFEKISGEIDRTTDEGTLLMVSLVWNSQGGATDAALPTTVSPPSRSSENRHAHTLSTLFFTLTNNASMINGVLLSGEPLSIEDPLSLLFHEGVNSIAAIADVSESSTETLQALTLFESLTRKSRATKPPTNPTASPSMDYGEIVRDLRSLPDTIEFVSHKEVTTKSNATVYERLLIERARGSTRELLDGGENPIAYTTNCMYDITKPPPPRQSAIEKQRDLSRSAQKEATQQNRRSRGVGTRTPAKQTHTSKGERERTAGHRRDNSSRDNAALESIDVAVDDLGSGVGRKPLAVFERAIPTPLRTEPRIGKVNMRTHVSEVSEVDSDDESETKFSIFFASQCD